jgi:beta-glucosidase
MTLDEKLGELVLSSSGSYGNVNSGVARLCVPSLTLQDGPAGLAFGDTGVTQLPAPPGIAATFDTALARRYGQVEGSEAQRLRGSEAQRLGARASTSSKGRT